MKRQVLIACLAGTAALSIRSFAQATSTAERRFTIQLGAGATWAKPDYSPNTITGITVYGTLDFSRHWGIEGDIHDISIITPADIGEDSYLLGPRYVMRHKRLTGYGKALLGFGRFNYLYDNVPHASFTYKIYSLGGGLDFKATPHINVRALDFEYQSWPGYPTHGISPLVLTMGAAYAFR